MAKRHSGFTAGFAGMKGGVFTCDMCGKSTRDTGENASCGLCPKCYNECQLENEHSDHGHPVYNPKCPSCRYEKEVKNE